MPQPGKHRTVFLVGFMGAGKSSVGRSLGHRLGWIFEDLDDRIEASAGRSIAEIFRDLGEAEFRRMESAALSELLSKLKAGPRVVALGGGAFAQPENAALLESAGVHVIFLDGSVEELFRRCQQEQKERPLLQDVTRFRRLYDERRSLYLRASCHVDTTGKDVEQVAVEVACKIGLG